MRDPADSPPTSPPPAALVALQARLERLTAQAAAERQAREAALAAERLSPDEAALLNPPAARPEAPVVSAAGHRRGSSALRLIEQAQLSLFDLERRGRFVQLPLEARSEFPSLLARLPLFLPGQRSRQRARLDHDLGLRFATPWGTGRKFGPPLTVYDEDTLIAIGLLRQKRLVGQGAKLPIPVNDLEHGYESRVHVLFTTLSDIEAILGNSKNGAAFALRLASVRRLSNVRIEFERVSDRAVTRGTSIGLIDVQWERWTKEAILYIQFTPVMARWFERAYTYLDFTVRRQLSPTGKAVHRFLSSQPKTYEISVAKLLETIAYERATKYFLRDLRQSLDRMATLGWLKHYALIGNGREDPYKLRIER